MQTVKVEKITLLYSCPECGDRVSQNLSDIVEVGTAVCSECDVDMELEDFATIKD